MADDSTIRIPDTMKRLVVTQPGPTVEACQFQVQTVPVPQPGSGQVLVRVAAAAVNPSDYGSWTRARPDQCPYACGKEGSGVVVKIGETDSSVAGLLSKLGGVFQRVHVGQKVGFIGLKDQQGAYSEYVVCNATSGVFPLPDELPVEDAASFFVNPYTSLAILDTAKAAGSKALVHTAAASQLGQMMVQVAPSEGVEIINVVRRPEQAELLQKLGATHVVVTTEDGSWKDTLRAKVKELGATVAFDAVAGSSTGDMLDVLPKHGTCYVYGGLAGKCSNIDPMNLIYHGKKVHGFLLNDWISKGDWFNTLPRMIAAGKKVNAGLLNDGWSRTQFQDTVLENAQTDLVALLKGSATGRKLRVRLDGASSAV